MKYKLNDEVAVISQGDPRMNQKGVITRMYNNSCPYLVKFPDGKDSYFKEHQLALANTFDGLVKGDVVVDRYGDERTVLARLEDLVFLSLNGNYPHSGTSYHIQELQDNRYTLKTPAATDTETIEINGKKYNKAEVDECLEALKLVK